MIIELDQESKKWIASKGNEITVKIMEVDACCAPPIQELIAIPGKPQSYGHYHPLQVDNLTVYIQKHLCSNEKLTLKLSGFSIFKTISAKLQ